MSTPTKQQAKQAARADALPTGPAGIPGTQPAAGTRPRLSPEERAKRAAELYEKHLTAIEYRATQVCLALVDMGVSSLQGQARNYTDVPTSVFVDAVEEVQKRLDAVKATLAIRSTTTTVKATKEKPRLNLRNSIGQPVQAQ